MEYMVIIFDGDVESIGVVENIRNSKKFMDAETIMEAVHSGYQAKYQQQCILPRSYTKIVIHLTRRHGFPFQISKKSDCFACCYGPYLPEFSK